MADNEKELKLVISAYTKGLEAGIKKAQDDIAKLKATTNEWNADLTAASNALDVRPTRLVQAEVVKLRAEYAKLKKSGLLSQKDLAKAAANLKTKTAELRGEQTRLNTTMKTGAGITNSMVGGVKNLIAAYVGYRAISGIYSTITTAARDAEQSQFNLTASVQAAGREFENTGGLDDWQSKITELSAKLKIYSESDVANAAARTIDMTKRLGLSAEQMNVLIQRTADLSAGKTDLEGGIERVTAALRGEAEASEYLGLTLNETYVKSWHEANNATGKAWKDLTDLEKAQVRYNVLLEQSEALQGRAAASATTFNGSLQLIQSSIANAIANNEDLSDAMARVATVISDNADEIGDMAAQLADAIGWVIDFTVNNRELLAVLIGSGGLIYALGKTAGAITSIGTAIDTVSAKKLPEVLGSGGSINAALMARLGLYGALAATIVKTVAEYNSMREAQDEAAAAAQRAADTEAYWQGVANAAADSTGLQIASIYELNNLIREGVVVRNELTGQYQTAAQAEAEHNAEVQNQIELNRQRNESFQEITDLAAQMTEKYGDMSAEAINASAKQKMLDEAMRNSKSPVEKAAAAVDKLADSYMDASNAIDLLEKGEAGYQDALDDKLKAEQKYAAAVEQLRSAQLAALEDTLDNEETALENSLDRRLIELEEELQDELITKRDYDYEKAKAEQQHAEQVLAIRRRLYDEAAKLYGADSQAAIEAHNDVIAAENDLARATNTTDVAFDKLYDNIERCGEAGRRAGKAGREGMDEYRKGVELTREEVKALREEEEAAAEQRRKAGREQLSENFTGQWNDITDHIKSFDSAAALQQWGQENYQELWGKGMLSGNQFITALNKHARDVFLDQLAALNESARNIAPSSPAAANQSGSGQSSQAQPKQMTLNLKAAGRSVAVSTAEADVGKVLDVLEQAGLVTA